LQVAGRCRDIVALSGPYKSKFDCRIKVYVLFFRHLLACTFRRH